MGPSRDWQNLLILVRLLIFRVSTILYNETFMIYYIPFEMTYQDLQIHGVCHLNVILYNFKKNILILGSK